MLFVQNIEYTGLKYNSTVYIAVFYRGKQKYLWLNNREEQVENSLQHILTLKVFQTNVSLIYF